MSLSLTDRLQMVTIGLVERFEITSLEDKLFRARIAMRTELSYRTTHAATVRKTQQELDKAIQQITRHQIQAIAKGSDFSPYLSELEHLVQNGQRPSVPQPLWERMSYSAVETRPRLAQLEPHIAFADACGRATSSTAPTLARVGL